jgi:hypothetical protein
VHIVEVAPLYWATAAVAGLVFAFVAAADRRAAHWLTAAVFLGAFASTVVFAALRDLAASDLFVVLHGVSFALLLAGSLGFGAVVVLRILEWLLTRSPWRRAREREDAGMSHFVRSAPDFLVDRWLTWPFVVGFGLLLAISDADAVSDEDAAALFVLFMLLAGLVYMVASVFAEMREVNRTVALKELAATVLMCEVAAAVITWQWPTPGDGELFGVLAQINATLFVAAAIPVAAPQAWARTLRQQFAWVTLAPLTAAIGLVASIGGALDPSYSPRVLLALSMGSVLPVALALIYGLYEKVHPGVGDDLDDATRAAFKTAYVRAGGRDALGKPVGRAALWPEGATQELSGGADEVAGIVGLWDAPPVVLRGDDWRTFAEQRADGAHLKTAYEPASSA